MTLQNYRNSNFIAFQYGSTLRQASLHQTLGRSTSRDGYRTKHTLISEVFHPLFKKTYPSQNHPLRCITLRHKIYQEGNYKIGL